MAKRDLSEHQRACVWWGESILGRPFSFANDRRAMSDWSNVLKAAHEIGATLLDVQILMLKLHSGQHEFTEFQPWNVWAIKNKLDVPLSPRHLIYCRPKGRSDVNLLQAELEIPDAPPRYELFEFAEWVGAYGKRAIASGKWTGIFPYLPNVDPVTNLIPPFELEKLIGKECVELSMAKLRELESEMKNATWESLGRGFIEKEPDHSEGT